MQTTSDHGLRKIQDMTRLISLVVLGLHSYYCCYHAFETWQITGSITDRLLTVLHHSEIFENFHSAKLISIGFLIISMVGERSRKDPQLTYKTGITYLLIGLGLYYLSYHVLSIRLSSTTAAILYMTTTTIGYILVLSGGTWLSRVFQQKFSNNDIFNRENESFPQEEIVSENCNYLSYKRIDENQYRLIIEKEI
ncbi:hypothetical protein EXU57_23080 [Segetibacter sp. 3557_3]|uniref:YWFCY domain-containing protein n=1 Tax=Segetibacter sp. 3557_3 TaxID=2547429 RepID=UPI001058D245|nr:YWFCY domain-containing protein [Segetibacter sp. 3557_3]TDH18485.1 hypothetical protein EXU57_23080 [Segetibacter sp. 3557_3]